MEASVTFVTINSRFPIDTRVVSKASPKVRTVLQVEREQHIYQLLTLPLIFVKPTQKGQKSTHAGFFVSEKHKIANLEDSFDKLSCDTYVWTVLSLRSTGSDTNEEKYYKPLYSSSMEFV